MYAAFTLALLTTISHAAPVPENLLEKAQKIEEQMDQVKPLFADSKSAPENVTQAQAEGQMKIADNVALLTNAAAKAKPLDDKTLEAIVHVIVRDYLYEQNPEAINRKFINKYADRIRGILDNYEKNRVSFERSKPYDDGRIEKVRVQLAISSDAQRGTTSTTKPTKKRVDTPKSSNDDGAALSPCDTGGVECPATAVPTLAPPAKRSLIRLPSTATGASTASRN